MCGSLAIACMVCLLLGLCSGGALAAGPQIGRRAVSPEAPARYGRVEITFTLSRSYDNPFDPRQIAVAALVRSPTGRTLTVPGFPYQDYRLVTRDGHEDLDPVGEPVWKVRFAPVETGRHLLTLTARDAQGETRADPLTLEVADSRSDGFVRVSGKDPTRFAFDSGRPYFALGENVCWAHWSTTMRDYTAWFGHLSAAGGNWARLWLAASWSGISPIHDGGHPEDIGYGRYSQRNSWRLDRVVEMAEQQGIRLMFCLDSFNSLRAGDPYPAFAQYTQNAKFGGPLTRPTDFWTSAEAAREFQARMRYYVARWGYSTSVFAWEFWNEVDLCEGFSPATAAAWHREMARHLRALDPWDHLITTSFAHSDGFREVDRLPELDFVQTHRYGAWDPAGALLTYSDKRQIYRRPHLIGEFGTGGDPNPKAAPPFLHAGLWASALSGDAGTAMTWWWDSEVEPGNLYPHFAALSRFLAGTDWLSGYRPVRAGGLRYLEGARAGSLQLTPRPASWEKHPANEPRTFRVGRDGRVSNQGNLSRLLHGTVNHPDLHNPATFLVDYAQPGEFAVLVQGVSGWGGAGLRIWLDGRVLLERDFPDSEPDRHEDLHAYDGAYSIPVPPGRHRITVENPGKDWFYVAYRLVGYVTAPQVRVVGLGNGKRALLWLQNLEQVMGGESLRPCRVALTLPGLADGQYAVEWWDTYTGKVISRENATCRKGRLPLETPEMTSDLACKVRLSAAP